MSGKGINTVLDLIFIAEKNKLVSERSKHEMKFGN